MLQYLIVEFNHINLAGGRTGAVLFLLKPGSKLTIIIIVIVVMKAVLVVSVTMCNKWC